MGSNNRTLIAMDKQYKTECGEQVYICTTNGQGAFPVVGQIRGFSSSGWSAASWDIFGNSRGSNPRRRLVEVDHFKGIEEGDIIALTNCQGRVYYKMYAGNKSFYEGGRGTNINPISNWSASGRTKIVKVSKVGE